jgi:peptidoglycan/LPS O-acetylase OafA/YrhL
MSVETLRWRAVLLGPTLADLQQHDRDNLLLLRLCAAALVIFGHSYAVKAGPVEHDFIANAGWGAGIYTGSLAVDAFFFISGFLVTGSWLRQRSLKSYLQARAVRVLPAYWVLLLCTVLLIGPLYTTLPLRDYFSHADTWAYLWGNAIYEHRWVLPGVLADNPNPATINGSLWTLRPEVIAYLALAGAGVCGLLRRGWLFALTSMLVLAAVLTLGPRLFSADYLRLFLLFGLGCSCWMARSWLRVNLAVLIALPLLTWSLHGTSAFGYLLMLSTAYACLWLAYIPRLGWLEPPGDYSYGIYLWGYPVQQIVVFHTQSASVPTVFLLSLLLAGILAVFSWHWLEAPLLRKFRPRRASRDATKAVAVATVPTRSAHP